MARKIQLAWITLRIDARLAWDELMSLVDSRTVRLFQIIVYGSGVLFGLYAALFAEPVSVVDQAMGNIVYTIWVWMNLACPAVVAVGCYLSRRRPGNPTRAATTNGMILQLAGNLGMVFTYGAYFSALMAAAWWGKGTYASFTTFALMLCAALLVVGDVRRLRIHSEWSPSGHH